MKNRTTRKKGKKSSKKYSHSRKSLKRRTTYKRKTMMKKRKMRFMKGGDIGDLENFLINEPENRENPILEFTDIKDRILSAHYFVGFFEPSGSRNILQDLETLFPKYNISQEDVTDTMYMYDDSTDYNENILDPIMEEYNNSNGYLLK